MLVKTKRLPSGRRWRQREGAEAGAGVPSAGGVAVALAMREQGLGGARCYAATGGRQCLGGRAEPSLLGGKTVLESVRVLGDNNDQARQLGFYDGGLDGGHAGERPAARRAQGCVNLKECQRKR